MRKEQPSRATRRAPGQAHDPASHTTTATATTAPPPLQTTTLSLRSKVLMTPTPPARARLQLIPLPAPRPRLAASLLRDLSSAHAANRPPASSSPVLLPYCTHARSGEWGPEDSSTKAHRVGHHCLRPPLATSLFFSLHAVLCLHTPRPSCRNSWISRYAVSACSPGTCVVPIKITPHLLCSLATKYATPQLHCVPAVRVDHSPLRR